MATPKKTEKTYPTVTGFRLGSKAIAALDRIAAKMTRDLGLPINRTSALRMMIERECERLEIKGS